MSSAHRKAFTLVELLVVISIIGMLMALLLPAVQQARESGRRNTCNSNLHNLGLSVQNFAGARGGRQLPGWRDTLSLSPAPTVGGNTITQYPVSWVVPLMPYFEKETLYKHWRNGDFLTAGPMSMNPVPFLDPVQQGYIEILVCPSNPPGQTYPPPNAYVVNSGQPDVQAMFGSAGMQAMLADYQANGAFFDNFQDSMTSMMNEVPMAATCNMGPQVINSLDYIGTHDGLSLTFMVSENLDAGSYADPNQTGLSDNGMTGGGGMGGMGGNLPYAVIESLQGFVWWGDVDAAGNFTPPFASGFGRINSPSDVATNNNPYYPYTNARPSSRHPGGVNMLFCDGHSRFIRQEIDYVVYCLLMSSNGEQVMPAGGMMLPNTATWAYLRTAPVSDASFE